MRWSWTNPVYTHTTTITLYEDQKTERYWSPELILTLHTNRVDWPVDYFMSFSRTAHKLFSTGFQGENGGEYFFTENSGRIKAGIIKRISSGNRMVIGLQYTEYDHQTFNNGYFGLILQFDFINYFATFSN